MAVPSFKDQMAADMDSVFLNLDEFGAQHTIEGVSVVAVMTEEAGKAADAQGMTVAGVRLHAKAVDVPTLYIGKTLMIDGIPYTVMSEPDICGGGLTVVLNVNQQ